MAGWFKHTLLSVFHETLFLSYPFFSAIILLLRIGRKSSNRPCSPPVPSSHISRFFHFSAAILSTIAANSFVGITGLSWRSTGAFGPSSNFSRFPSFRRDIGSCSSMQSVCSGTRSSRGELIEASLSDLRKLEALPFYYTYELRSNGPKSSGNLTPTD